MGLWLVLLLVVAALSVPLVHEAGHAFAAVVVGGRRIRLVRGGRLLFLTSADLPERVAAVRLFYAGGPLANVLASVALAILSRTFSSTPSASEWTVACLALALVHLAFALLNLLPLPGHDGRFVLAGSDLVDDAAGASAADTRDLS